MPCPDTPAKAFFIIFPTLFDRAVSLHRQSLFYNNARTMEHRIDYDIQARQYFAMAPMWDKIDPLEEIY